MVNRGFIRKYVGIRELAPSFVNNALRKPQSVELQWIFTKSRKNGNRIDLALIISGMVRVKRRLHARYTVYTAF